MLAGSWGKNQHAKGKVFSRNPTDKYFQEVEQRLRSAITPHRCTGYEVFWRCLKTEAAYAEIVRRNGKIGDFTSLKKLSGPQHGGKDGDLVEATVFGNVLKGFVNGVELISVTDDVFDSGSPGIGFNFFVGDANCRPRLHLLRGGHLQRLSLTGSRSPSWAALQPAGQPNLPS